MYSIFAPCIRPNQIKEAKDHQECDKHEGGWDMYIIGKFYNPPSIQYIPEFIGGIADIETEQGGAEFDK